MLLCLTTGQRRQTIHKLDTDHIQEMEDRYKKNRDGQTQTN